VEEIEGLFFPGIGGQRDPANDQSSGTFPVTAGPPLRNISGRRCGGGR
jgi:hypothetical protein